MRSTKDYADFITSQSAKDGWEKLKEKRAKNIEEAASKKKKVDPKAFKSLISVLHDAVSDGLNENDDVMDALDGVVSSLYDVEENEVEYTNLYDKIEDSIFKAVGKAINDTVSDWKKKL